MSETEQIIERVHAAIAKELGFDFSPVGDSVGVMPAQMSSCPVDADFTERVRQERDEIVAMYRDGTLPDCPTQL